MRSSHKSNDIMNAGNQLLDVNFHDFLNKQSSSTMVELASEFGLSLGDVQKLKKHLSRS